MILVSFSNQEHIAQELQSIPFLQVGQFAIARYDNQIGLFRTQKEESMLVKDVMSKNLYCCVASDTAQAAAKTMMAQSVGALPVVADSTNRKLQGIVTDRDLCCSVVAGAKLAETTRIADVMTRNPIVCAAENTLEDCEELMQKHRVRRLPVTDKQGRCIGVVSQADIALHAPAGRVAKMVSEISKPAKRRVVQAGGA